MMMKRKNSPWTPVLALVLLLAGGVGGWLIAQDTRAPAAKPLPVLGEAPEFRGLTNQLGASVDSSRFDGKVQVVTFLFPYCTTYCPLIAAHLAGLESTLELARLKDRVEIVAYNVDPGGVGPEQMRAFLEEFGWNPKAPNLEFLTGTPQQIRRVVAGGYHVAYEKVPDGAEPGGGPELTPQPEVLNKIAARAHVDYDIVHNDALEIVDPQGRIRKFYPQADVVSTARLLHVIKSLLPSGS
jgi:protein SCO1